MTEYTSVPLSLVPYFLYYICLSSCPSDAQNCGIFIHDLLWQNSQNRPRTLRKGSNSSLYFCLGQFSPRTIVLRFSYILRPNSTSTPLVTPSKHRTNNRKRLVCPSLPFQGHFFQRYRKKKPCRLKHGSDVIAFARVSVTAGAAVPWPPPRLLVLCRYVWAPYSCSGLDDPPRPPPNRCPSAGELFP